MKPIIEAKNIGKKYNINHQKGGYVTFRDILTNTIKNPLKFLKTKTKEVLGIETKEEFWALGNVNFEIMKGEVVGIIGRNGAGKSTLLKILSQITPPTTGEIRINGTVGSLLEVGTGFHPELTGRENIFLNGAILGMKKNEIIKKFDEIVKFAGVEKFLDTPVKYYSSGMYVRLAFSVAAHMDTDILIIDEVLAVGDAEFQKKCLGKMDEITKKEGKTILFVSHNMAAIQQLCDKSILLEKGQIKLIGETDKVVTEYLSTNQNINGFNNNSHRFTPNEISIIDAKIFKNKSISNQFNYGDEIEIKIQIKSLVATKNCAIEIIIRDAEGYPLIFLPSGLRFNKEFDFNTGENFIECKINSLPLAEGSYYMDIVLAESGKKFYDYAEKALMFKIIFCDPNKTGHSFTQNSKQGSVYIPAEFFKIDTSSDLKI